MTKRSHNKNNNDLTHDGCNTNSKNNVNNHGHYARFYHSTSTIVTAIAKTKSNTKSYNKKYNHKTKQKKENHNIQEKEEENYERGVE